MDGWLLRVIAVRSSHALSFYADIINRTCEDDQSINFKPIKSPSFARIRWTRGLRPHHVESANGLFAASVKGVVFQFSALS
jgi:hypothetical protein